MADRNRSAESPPPETQTGRQVQSPTAKGQVSDSNTNADTNKEFLNKLESNPKPVLDDHRNDMFSKDVKDKTYSNLE